MSPRIRRITVALAASLGVLTAAHSAQGAIVSVTPSCYSDAAATQVISCGNLNSIVREPTNLRRWIRWAVVADAGDTIDLNWPNTLNQTAFGVNTPNGQVQKCFDPPAPLPIGTYTTPIREMNDGLWSRCAARSRPAPTLEVPVPVFSAWSPLTGVPILVDRTPPTASATASRPPEATGWYTSPVTISWSGQDPAPSGGGVGSGIGPCTAARTYSGPETTAAGTLITGSCIDLVGNTSTNAARNITIKYDATPPALSNVTAVTSGGNNLVSWQVSADTTKVEVWRTHSQGGADTLIYTSTFGNQVLDPSINPLAAYTYRIIAFDPAGNRAVQLINPTLVQAPTPPPSPPTAPTPVVTIAQPLLRPRDRSIVRVAPIVRWPAVAGAKYYNVQLFINGKKVLSAWPKVARYNMPTKWTYNGKRYRMPRGVRVRWYVWPAFGTTSKPKFGTLIGTARFTLTKKR